MSKFLDNVKKAGKAINDSLDKSDDLFDKKLSKGKKSKIAVAFNKVINSDLYKGIMNVISWILFAIIIDMLLTFIRYPLTAILFLLLALIVMPTFNTLLEKKGIKIAFWKKLLLSFIILIIIFAVSPVANEDGSINTGIEGVNYIFSNNKTVIIDNENLPVVDYAVNYYYDNTLRYSEKYQANLYDVITFYEDKSFDNYVLVNENNFPLEINSESLKDNVINIYYRTKKNGETSSIENVQEGDVLTEEQLNSLSDEQLAELEAEGAIQKTNEVAEWSRQEVKECSYEEIKNQLGKEVDSTMKYLVYKVEYVYDDEIDDEATSYFKVPSGTQVTDVSLKDKDGYTFKEKTNLPVTIKDNSQVIKVVYEKSSQEEQSEEQSAE